MFAPNLPPPGVEYERPSTFAVLEHTNRGDMPPGVAWASSQLAPVSRRVRSTAGSLLRLVRGVLRPFAPRRADGSMRRWLPQPKRILPDVFHR